MSDEPNITVVKNEQLKFPQRVNAADYKIYIDNGWLVNLILFNEWSKKDIRGGFKCFTNLGPLMHPYYRTCSEADWNDESKRDFAHTFEGNIYFARLLKQSGDITYGLLGAYILPPLYAMLGACAFGFRNLLGNSSPPLSSMDAMGPLVRLPLAALSGFVVGLFADATKGLSVSPLAIAFLVGYAAEIFFSFLDIVIEATKVPSKRAQS